MAPAQQTRSPWEHWALLELSGTNWSSAGVTEAQLGSVQNLYLRLNGGLLVSVRVIWGSEGITGVSAQCICTQFLIILFYAMQVIFDNTLKLVPGI